MVCRRWRGDMHKRSPGLREGRVEGGEWNCGQSAATPQKVCSTFRGTPMRQRDAEDTIYLSSLTCAEAQTSLCRITTKLHCKKPRWGPRKTCFVGCCGFTAKGNFTCAKAQTSLSIRHPQKAPLGFPEKSDRLFGVLVPRDRRLFN